MSEIVSAVMEAKIQVTYMRFSKVAAQVKAWLRSLVSLSSVGWKSFSRNMNRVV